MSDSVVMPGSKPLKDTPTKPSTSRRIMLGESARQIQDDVAKDLKNNVRIVSPAHFREKLLHFPDDKDLSKAFRSVKEKHYKKGRWKGFPTKAAREAEYYEPFVNICQSINQACRDSRRASAEAIQGVWVDCHSKAPETTSKDCPKIRPDIVQVSASTLPQFQKLDRDLRQTKTVEKSQVSVL
jgi:hypothetical protein